MERLTMNNGLCQMASTEFCLAQKDCYSCSHGRKCFKRLAAYEDTGMEPEEVTELMAAHGTAILDLSEYRSIGPAKHLLDLAQAEKDGRIVLPCRLHESIFYIEDGEWFDDVPYGVNIGQRQGEWKDSLLFECEYGFNFYEEDIGNTVFLTREEAEAALKRREADNEKSDSNRL